VWAWSCAHLVLLSRPGSVDRDHSAPSFRFDGPFVDIRWPADCGAVAGASQSAAIVKQCRDSAVTRLVYLRRMLGRGAFIVAGASTLIAGLTVAAGAHARITVNRSVAGLRSTTFQVDAGRVITVTVARVPG
jgi:hypothetical protein